MKRVLLYIGIALAAIGCTKSEISENTSADGEINFCAGVSTRLSSTDDCTWISGDEIGIFTNQVDYTSTDTYNASTEKNLKFTINNVETGAMTNQSKEVLFPLIPLDEEKRTYYAYYPYSIDRYSGPTISIDLTKDYSTPLLWATAESNATEVSLQFTHMLPKVTFNLKAGGLDVSSLTGSTVTLKGAYSSANFYIANYNDYNGGAFYSSSVLNDINLSIENSNTITAYIIPMENENYTVKDNVELWITTAESNTFIYSLSTEYWERGTKYEYNITVGEELIND